MAFQQIIEKFNLHPRELFLLDAVGALLSTFLLGVVLVRFDTAFGMPKPYLYGLSLVACIFASYSFLCYLRIPKNWRLFLKLIAIANFIYCCITIGLVIKLYQELTILGHLYFIGELPILTSLIYIELKTTFRNGKSN